MRLSGRAAALAFSITVVMAGCVAEGEGAGASASATGGAARAPGDAVPDAAMVEGTVVDDSFQAIAGANVAIGDVVATTDAAGAYSITNLAPGTYQAFAAALGYTSAAKSVTLGPDERKPLSFTLVPLAVVEAYHELFGPFQGYFECRLGTPTQTGECGWVSVLDHPTFLYPNDRSIFRFNMTSEDWQTFQGEMHWNQGTFATSTEMRLAFSYEKRSGVHRWCSGEGPNPLAWRYEKAGLDESKCDEVGDNGEAPEPLMKLNPLRTYANVPFGGTSNPFYASVQQRFEVMVSAFYGEPAPEGFSAFGDQ